MKDDNRDKQCVCSTLITGGTGFFGKSILDYHQRHTLGALTILSRHPATFLQKYPHFENLSNVSFLEGDVRDFEFPNREFDTIIHAATPARVDVPDTEMRSIILDGTRHTLDFAKRCGCKKFMFVSSGGVYGKGFHAPISEEMTPRPVTVYGQSKLEAERMCVDSGFFTLLPRCFAFVGPYLDRNAHFAIGNFIRDSLAGKPIVIKGDGSPMRSYLYADDLVEWLWTILERGEHGRPYNVGSDEAVSISMLAERVNSITGSKSDIQVLGQSVPGAADYYVPAVERVIRELNVKINVHLEAAIRRSIEKN